MKKKIVALTLCLGMIAALTGCGKDSDNNQTQKKVTKLEYTLEKEGYMGLEVENSKSVVTEEELQKYIDSDLKANAKEETIKEGVLEKDMDVNIDYKGTVEGKTYTERKASVLTLKDGVFAIDGFTDALIGKKVGETVKFTLTFPKDYDDKSYAEKEIEFEVKINHIVKTTIPELNDEYVKEVYEYLGISTVDEYKAEYERNIKINKIYAEVWPQIVKNIKIKTFDSVELDKLTTEIAEQQEMTMSSYYGMTLDEYLEAVSQSKADFMAECEGYAKEQITNELIVKHIAEAEGITVSDEEYKEELAKTMVAYDLETEEEFYKYFKDYGYDEAYFRQSFLMNKVIEFVCDNIVVVEDKEEESTTAATK